MTRWMERLTFILVTSSVICLTMTMILNICLLFCKHEILDSMLLHYYTTTHTEFSCQTQEEVMPVRPFVISPCMRRMPFSINRHDGMPNGRTCIASFCIWQLSAVCVVCDGSEDLPRPERLPDDYIVAGYWCFTSGIVIIAFIRGHKFPQCLSCFNCSSSDCRHFIPKWILRRQWWIWTCNIVDCCLSYTRKI